MLCYVTLINFEVLTCMVTTDLTINVFPILYCILVIGCISWIQLEPVKQNLSLLKVFFVSHSHSQLFGVNGHDGC